LKAKIEAKGQPSKFDSEIQVIPIPSDDQPIIHKGETFFTDTYAAEVYLNGFICDEGNSYPFSAMHPVELLKLIDEVSNAN
jgi:hypothetical protein